MTRKQSAKALDKLGFGNSRNAGAAISRMPRKLRDEVSTALVDGADWRKISALCAGHGFPGVKAQNVTNYRHGAHKDWLAREERMEALRRDSENTAAVVQHYAQNGGSPAQAGLLAAAEIMSQALHGMGPEALQQLLADDPKALFGLVRELSRVTGSLEKTQDGKTQDAREEKPTLTPDQRAAALKEIFGLPS